jgi:hypothetical protein
LPFYPLFVAGSKEQIQKGSNNKTTVTANATANTTGTTNTTALSTNTPAI